MKGYKVRLQRLCFADVELDVPDDVPPGRVAADVMGAVLAGATDADWQVAPLSETTVVVKGIREIAPAQYQGHAAMTTDVEESGAYDDDDDGGVPVSDIPIPPDGLKLDDDGDEIPLDGLKVDDESPEIPHEGLPVGDADVGDMHDIDGLDEEGEPID